SRGTSRPERSPWSARSSASSRGIASARTTRPGRGARRRARGRTDVEIVTKKKLLLFAGTTHPALAQEIADNLGVPLSPAKMSRFASGEIYFRSEESVRR